MDYSREPENTEDRLLDTTLASACLRKRKPRSSGLINRGREERHRCKHSTILAYVDVDADDIPPSHE